ncbi:MAG: hypothetical protein FWC98_03785 [Bacteroidales bacterium]|nr:hypothetical protein [Bacteroidales bacterium]
MKTKTIVQIALGIATIVLTYFLFESIMKPQRFETLRARKEVEVVNRLRDIRTAQVAFRNVHGHFAGTMDTLVHFLEEGTVPIVRRIGYIPDTLTEAEALRMGIISRDTTFINAYEALFIDSVNFPHRDRAVHMANFRWIPFTNRTKEFSVEAGFIERNNIQIPVVEVSAFLLDYMDEPEFRQLAINAVKRARDINRFPGRRFGSMTEPITEGNWE